MNITILIPWKEEVHNERHTLRERRGVLRHTRGKYDIQWHVQIHICIDEIKCWLP